MQVSTADYANSAKADRGNAPSSSRYSRVRAIRHIEKGLLGREFALDAIAFTEAIIVFFCALAAKYFYLDLYLEAHTAPVSISIWVVGIWGAMWTAFIMKYRGHYEFDALATKRPKVSRIFRALSFAFLLIIALGYAAKEAENYSRGWFIIWFILCFVSLSVERKLVSRLMRSGAYRGVFNTRVAILGSGDMAQRVAEHLSADGNCTTVVGMYHDYSEDQNGEGSADTAESAGSIADLVVDGQQNRFDQIVIALPSDDARNIRQAINRLSILPMDILFCPNEVAFALHRPTMVYSGDLGLLNVYGKPITGWGNLTKKVLDYGCGALVLFLLSIPMSLIALAIKLSDPDKPVFFKQQRHGYNHEVIKVWKFRTMTVMEDGSKVEQAAKNDMRVTPIGRILRKTSLDELPQLFNVMRGEMSLVGPRPHALAHNNQYSSMLELYANRHKVKPGITGWAQVNGYRGETKDPALMEKRVELDLEYIYNWTIWFDLKILFLTPIHILFGKNAY